MAKKLSEQLADLAVRAKHAEDAFTAAQEAHDKIVVSKRQRAPPRQRRQRRQAAVVDTKRTSRLRA